MVMSLYLMKDLSCSMREAATRVAVNETEVSVSVEKDWASRLDKQLIPFWVTIVDTPVVSPPMSIFFPHHRQGSTETKRALYSEEYPRLT